MTHERLVKASQLSNANWPNHLLLCEIELTSQLFDKTSIQSAKALQTCATMDAECAQVTGHIFDEEGRKVYALQGAWNSHLSMVRCDAEGAPLPDAPMVELWKVCDFRFLSTWW